MSETAITHTGGGAFATARRGGIDEYERAFIKQKRERGVPVQHIASMLGRPVSDVAAMVEAMAVVAPPPKAYKPPPPADPFQVMHDITRAHAIRWGVTVEDIRGRRIDQRFHVPRCIVVARILQTGRFTQAQVGQFFNRRDRPIRRLRNAFLELEAHGLHFPPPEPEPPPPREVYRSIASVLKEIADKHGLTVADLRDPSHYARVAHPRQEAMWACRQILKADGTPAHSYPAIGAAIGGRHHTTILSGVRTHQARLDAMQTEQAA